MRHIVSRIVKKYYLPGVNHALWLALILIALTAIPVWADSLENLRASGAIGESSNGYVVARDPGAREEADEINAKRRVIYQGEATTQGVDINQVAKVYAAEIIRTVPPGTWIQTNGQWKRK